MSYRRQIRVGAKQPISAVIRNAASALKGIFDEFGIEADDVCVRRIAELKLIQTLV
jgi:hypothetical protein